MNKNNNLTQINEGSTHEQNPLNGVPIGNNNSVEQGETIKNNFVYSNRIILDENAVSQYNLPKSLVGKSVADATKYIDNKFKGRNDKISQSTKDSMLSKIAEAQESMKPQEPEIEQSVPEEMGNSSQMACGGNIHKYWDGGYMQYDKLNPNQGIGYKFGQNNTMNSQSIAQQDAGMEGEGPSPQAIIGAAGTALDLGNIAFGKSQQNTSGNQASTDVNTGGIIAGNTLKGASAGASFGPLGAGIGAGVGAIAGFLGSRKEKKAALENSNNYAIKTNNQFSDQYAMGGGLNSSDRGSDKKPYPMVESNDFAGGNRSYPIPTEADAVDALRLAGLHGRDDIRSKVYSKYPNLKHAYGGQIDPNGSHIMPDGTIMANSEMIAPTTNLNPIFNTKNIVRYQPGVTSGRDGSSGFYLYSKLPTDKGFNVESDREFVRNENMGALQRTPQWQEYMKSKSINNTFAKGGLLPLDVPLKANLELNPINKIYTGKTLNTIDQYNTKNYLTSANINDFKQPNITPINMEQPTFGQKLKLAGKETLGAINNTIKDTNLGNLARYAPIAMNAYQLSQLKKPQGESLDRLGNRYKPEYVDEASLQNIANQTMNNTVNAISQSGASQGQTRASILGSQLQRTKALSDAYNQAAATNRATNDRAQTFNLGVDQVNLQQSNTEKDINARDSAAYRNEKSKYLAEIGNNIGDIGKEEVYKNIAKTTTGYNWLGEYQKMNPNATPEETKEAAKKAGVLTDSTTKKALGGYLLKNKGK